MPPAADVCRNARERADRIRHIKSEVGKFSQIEGLKQCQSMANTLFGGNNAWVYDRDCSFSLWFVAYLAKEFLLYGRVDGGKPFDLQDCADLSLEYAAVSDALVFEMKEARSDTKLSALMRIAFERWYLCERVVHNMPRLYLTLVRPPDPTTHNLHAAIGGRLRAFYGLEYEELFRVAVAIHTLCRLPGFFDPELLLKSKDGLSPTWFTSETVGTTLKHLCTELGDFQRRQTHCLASQFDNRPYEFNYLREKPLVELPSGDIICPVPMLIADRLGTGVYFDMMHYYDQIGIGATQFTAAYGKLFEAYVGHILKRQLPTETELHAAESFVKCGRSDRQRPMCDWIVIENRSAVLIECKSGKLPKETCCTGDVQALRKHVVDRYLNKGKTQFELVFDRLRCDGYDVYSLIVYNDVMNIYNDFETVFADNPEIAKSLDELNAQFISIFEFEDMLMRLPSTSISDIVKRKLGDRQLRSGPFADVWSTIPTQLRAIPCLGAQWTQLVGLTP
jgi:hypothetical protein